MFRDHGEIFYSGGRDGMRCTNLVCFSGIGGFRGQAQHVLSQGVRLAPCKQPCSPSQIGQVFILNSMS